MRPVLDGVRVLDVGRYIAGPFCAAMLGDFGADVIRVERIGGGEDRWVTPVASGGEGALFMQVNRNKRSLALDLGTPDGLKALHRQVARADVVVANMPPRALRKLGLDYATLSAARPDIILTVTTAFGAGGPLSDKVGFDGVAQAMSGAVHLSGPPGQPSKLMVSYVDYGTAMACAFGTMAALYERRSSGHGQVVEASLLGTALTVANNVLIEQATLELDRVATGNRSPLAAPSDIFAVQDGWIIVQGIGDPMFRRLTRLLGRPELAEQSCFGSDQARGDHGAALSAVMAEWCAVRNRSDALTTLEAADIPCGPVYAPREVLHDPHVQASGAFEQVTFPGLDRPAPIARPPVGLSRTPPRISFRAPRLGEHSSAILIESGYNRSEIQGLLASGVVLDAGE